MKCFLAVLAVHLLASWAVAASAPFAVAERPVPVFNTVAAAASKTAVKPDVCGQVRALEFIALPDTVFTVIRQAAHEGQPVLEVTTGDYQAPPGTRLYVSPVGLLLAATQPSPRQRVTPRRETVVKNLRSALQTPYFWGGNLRSGVQLNGKPAYTGLDCSGLLYEATNGFTPRNTADLVSYGAAVPVAGLGREKILAQLQPLDLIVWKGHVIIVLDRETAIESVLYCGRPGNGGVMLSPLRSRLGEIMARRKPMDSWPEGAGKPQVFVVRRWLE